ncbi:MAG: DMT family transporter [Desulfobacterales bacterium]|nr:DMT family transporter [Desulfobacterales bacterium]
MGSMKPNEWGLLVILAVFWGASFFFVEVALRDFQPFTLVFLRIGLAALVLVGVVYISGKRLPTSFKTWAGYVVMGLLNNAIPFSLIVWGQTRIESGVASILNATTPIFTVLLAHFLTSDERLTSKKIMGILIGFIGVYLMMKPELTDGFSWRGLGQAAVLGAAVSYGFAGIFGKRFKDIPAVINSAGMLICSGIMMLPLAIIIDAPWSVRPSLEALSAVLAIAVISTAIAYLLYFQILATAGATNVLLVTFLIPISALLLGVGILGEVIKVVEYAGMGCIFLGLIIIDGRALGLLQRLTGRRAIESREETVSKAAS